MTCRPYSSTLVMSWSCVIPGIPYFRSNRVASSARRFVAILRATVSGEPTYRAPCGPVSRSRDSSVGGAKPRSAATRVKISRQRGQNSAFACSSVAATWPGECTSTGSGGRPNFSKARRNNCEYEANRSGGPPMMASARENPSRAARITDSGLPPTPIQVGNGPNSVCGTTSWFSSGARVLPSQVTGPPLSSSANRVAFSSKSSS